MEEIALAVLGRPVKVDRRLIKKSTDPQASIARRKSQGSPQPTEVKLMVTKRKKQLIEYKSELEKLGLSMSVLLFQRLYF
jgi:argininosuccinate lyase